MKHVFTTLLILLLASPLLTAQQRYKHVPRVKVKTPKTIVTQEPELSKSTTTITVSSFQPENSVDVTPSVAVSSEVQPQENTWVVSNSNIQEIKITHQKPIQLKAKQQKVISPKKTDWFTDKITKQTRLFKVKEVDKTNISAPILVMILLYVVGAILLILAVILYFTLPTFTLVAFLILLIAGAVLLAAASVMLTLFKMGVFS